MDALYAVFDSVLFHLFGRERRVEKEPDGPTAEDNEWPEQWRKPAETMPADQE